MKFFGMRIIEVRRYYLCVGTTCLKADGPRFTRVYELAVDSSRSKSTAETRRLLSKLHRPPPCERIVHEFFANSDQLTIIFQLRPTPNLTLP